MSPDISYILNFEKVRKEQVIESLGKFCINTEDSNFDVALISEDCAVKFIVDIEESLNCFYDLNK